MPAGATYDSISSTTLSSGQTSISLSSIPATYTDLRIVGMFYHGSGNSNVNMRLNGATNPAYNYGALSSAYSFTQGATSVQNIFQASFNQTDPGLVIVDILNYTQGNPAPRYSVSIKSWAPGLGNEGVKRFSLFFENAPINAISFTDVSSTNLGVGSTLSIYGITKA